MKKITSDEPITLMIDGQTTLEINSKGCIATDEHAEIAVARLGEHVRVVDTDVKKAVADAKEELSDAEKEAAKEAKKAEKEAAKAAK